MKILFEYPLATEENMKSIQEALRTTNDISALFDSFAPEILWDCFVMLSGQENVSWAVLDHCVENEQMVPEDWQYDLMDAYYEHEVCNASRNHLHE